MRKLYNIVIACYLLRNKITVNVVYMVSKIIPETLKLNKYINYIGVKYSICNKNIKEMNPSLVTCCSDQ
jgi:hypothetical protein